MDYQGRGRQEMKSSTNQSIALGDRDKRNTCWLIGCVVLYQTHERLEGGLLRRAGIEYHQPTFHLGTRWINEQGGAGAGAGECVG